MDGQDIRTLQVLEEFERNDETSQRALAEKLNVSLGLVNSFIKRLTRKGYFKVTNLPANRIKYILTPKGAAEKVKLTYDYVQYSFQYYKKTRTKLHAILNGMEKNNCRQLVFWGATELAEIAYISLQDTSMELLAIVDPDLSKKNFLGRKVHAPVDLDTITFDKILLTSAMPGNEVCRHLEDIGIDCEKLVYII